MALVHRESLEETVMRVRRDCQNAFGRRRRLFVGRLPVAQRPEGGFLEELVGNASLFPVRAMAQRRKSLAFRTACLREEATYG